MGTRTICNSVLWLLAASQLCGCPSQTIPDQVPTFPATEIVPNSSYPTDAGRAGGVETQNSIPFQRYFIVEFDKDRVSYKISSDEILMWPNALTALSMLYIKDRYSNPPINALRSCGVRPANLDSVAIHQAAHQQPQLIVRINPHYVREITHCMKKYHLLEKNQEPNNFSSSMLTGFDFALQTAPKTVLPDSSMATDLTAEQLSEAAHWASENLGQETLSELQKILALPLSGTLDEPTARAVYRIQQIWYGPQRLVRPEVGGKRRTNPVPNYPPGEPDYNFFYRLGIIPTRRLPNLQADPNTLQSISQLDSGTLVFFSYYWKTSQREVFSEIANRFAADNKAVGVVGDRIVVGQPIPVRDLSDVIVYTQALYKQIPSLAIKNIAILSHGEVWGMGLNSDNAFARKESDLFQANQKTGLHECLQENCYLCDDENCRLRYTSRIKPGNIHSFSKKLSPILPKNVRLLLFACMTGATPAALAGSGPDAEWYDITDEPEGELHMPQERKRGGHNSLADLLTKEFGAEATSIGHLTYGHATENYAIRFFGAEGGGQRGGLHAFEKIYDAGFINAELNRLGYPRTYYNNLRAEMWDHYICNIKLTRSNVKNIKNRYDKGLSYGNNGHSCKALRTNTGPSPLWLGQMIYINPTKAKDWFLESWFNTHKEPATPNANPSVL